jgi:type IX secretion system PorP/SprF family membrane protein
MKKILILSYILLSTFASVAQQEPMYSQYTFNSFVLNPAVAGSNDYIPIKLGIRRQWTGIADGPMTQMLSMHSSIGHANRMGVGGVIVHDQYGPLSKSGIRGAFAYTVNPDAETKFAFGLSLSCYQLSVDESNLNIINPNDAVINGEKESVIIPDADFGMYVHNERLFAGFSATQLIQYPLNLSNDLRKQIPHFYLLGGYRFKLSESADLEPSVLIKKNGPMPVQLDINARAIFSKDYWFGLSYRTQDAAVLMIGMNYNNFSIGYAFDYTLSKLTSINNGTHELILGFNLKHKKRISSPIL